VIFFYQGTLATEFGSSEQPPMFNVGLDRSGELIVSAAVLV